MAGPGLLIKRRLLAVLIIFSIIFGVLVVRSGWIQIVKGNKFKQMAFQQQTRGREISPMRGSIKDRNYKVLAISASAEKVSVNPQQFRASAANLQKAAQELADMLGLKQEDVYNKLIKRSSYETIKRKIDKKLGDSIRLWALDNKINGLYIDEDSKRYYPNGSLAAHVLGYTGVDNQGLDGIEAVMDQYLKGVPGRILSSTDARSRELPFSEEKHIDPKDGLNVVLTIDESIQFFAEKALDKAIDDNKVLNGATVIAMDPRSGDILALVSKPDYDPNKPFAAPLGSALKSWDDYVKDPNKSWMDMTDTEKVAVWNNMPLEERKKILSSVCRNKAVVDTYEPGSTFKAITAAAGLEENVVSPDTQLSDVPVVVKGKTIHCWKRPPHGTETFTRGVYNSCNPVFVQVAQKLGISKFYDYVRSFGFTRKTGICLPGEAIGQIHKKPTELDMATASFGQSFTVTPLQIITAYSAIANGGKLLKPRLVKELTDSDGNVVKTYDTEVVRNVISKQTSETLRKILEGVVSDEHGTGGNAYISGYRVAGKTGTSETLESRSHKAERYIASFASFAPADNPVICVLVILDYPTGPFGHGGGLTSAFVAKEILEDSLNYLGVERVPTEKDKELLAKEVIIPDLRNKTVAEAKNILTNMGLEFKIQGNGYNNNTEILEQTPKPNVTLSKRSSVVLYTYKPQNEANTVVPDLMNRTQSEAMDTLARAGLNIKVNGKGTVAMQKPTAGTKVPKGTIIDVELRLRELNDE